jgi:hypothetical protein
MNNDPGFEDYLTSKKIDSSAFRMAEPEVWASWKIEFEQVHPTRFTIQKLNLINPMRRKYLLHVVAVNLGANTAPVKDPATVRPARPVIKPKPDPGR